jgi:hypothetical protein
MPLLQDSTTSITSDAGAKPAPSAPASSIGYRGAVLRLARRISVLVVGLSVVLVGIVMIFTPGPAIVVIPLGLGILATEFLWARRILDVLKQRLIAGQEMLPESPLFRRLKNWLPQDSDSNRNAPQTSHESAPAPATVLGNLKMGGGSDPDGSRSAAGRRAG